MGDGRLQSLGSADQSRALAQTAVAGEGPCSTSVGACRRAPAIAAQLLDRPVELVVIALVTFGRLVFGHMRGAALRAIIIVERVRQIGFGPVIDGFQLFLADPPVAFPGRLSRMASAREAGGRAAQVALGCVVMLFLAALLEGFGRQLINVDAVRYTIAGGTLVIWLAYFYRPGRPGPGGAS